MKVSYNCSGRFIEQVCIRLVSASSVLVYLNGMKFQTSCINIL